MVHAINPPQYGDKTFDAFQKKAIASAFGPAASTTSKTYKVDVGKDGLTFTPNQVHANKGDVVEFTLSVFC